MQPLSVQLGYGILGNIFDGTQRPLKAIACVYRSPSLLPCTPPCIHQHTCPACHLHMFCGVLLHAAAVSAAGPWYPGQHL